MDLLDLMGADPISAAIKDAGPGWHGDAYLLLLEYMRENPLFKTEDVRVFAHGSRNLPAPPDLRAWGTVVQRAIREGLIKKVGHGASKNRTAHCRPVMVWQVVK